MGMIIGVGAVITMVALGTGAQTSIDAQIQSAGTNMIMVNAGNFNQGGVRQGQGNASTLTPDDADGHRSHSRRAVRIRRLEHAGPDSSPATRTGTRSSRAPTWTCRSSGHGPPRSGRSSLRRTLRRRQRSPCSARPCGISSSAPGVDPTGEVIRIANHPFTVAGVMAVKGQSAVGQDQDDVIFVPYTTVMKKMRGVTFIQQVTVSATSAGTTSQTADAIAAALRVRHKIQPGDPDDFMVRTMDEIASVRKETTQTMTALLASIAGVSLLVGGIGIMNIMLVSVTERTREIGLRMAIGARGSDVLLQFLVEAVVLSLFGGCIGIALGLRVVPGLDILVTVADGHFRQRCRRGLRVCGGNRRVFRLLSGRKAAALDPIEALRFE